MKLNDLLRSLIEIERAASSVVEGLYTPDAVAALAERISDNSRLLRQPFGIGRTLDALRGEIAVAAESVRYAVALAAEQPEAADKRAIVVDTSRTLLGLVDRFFQAAGEKYPTR